AYFRNGSRILILSSNPTSFRSNDGDVTLDEYAFHDRAQAIYTASQPCMFWLGDAYMELISTHNGPVTHFNRTCREAEAKRGRSTCHRTRLEDAGREDLGVKG